jgi:hypothetical protein
MTTQPILPKIAFIHDDRLSHDRKTLFTRTMSILKSKLNMDMLSTSMTEAEVIGYFATQSSYSLILLPWYKYLAWKKLESHFGALRMQGVTIAGYFADAVLPFEFSKIPNFNRMIMLDFYRMDQVEIEMMIYSLSNEGKKSGLAAFADKNTQIFHSNWFNQDSTHTRCIDAAMGIPLLKAHQWSARMPALRIYMTALWTLCYRERHSLQSTEACAEIEISEVNKRLAVKFVFESHELTLKHMMEHLWPGDAPDKDSTVRELVRHTDFLRVSHFPESHHVEITAFFTPDAPSQTYPGEVRGFWVEPLKNKFMRTREPTAGKRIPIHQAQRVELSEQVQHVLEQLRSIHHQLSSTPLTEKFQFEHQFSHIHFLLNEIEKKVAEKKKIA